MLSADNWTSEHRQVFFIYGHELVGSHDRDMNRVHRLEHRSDTADPTNVIHPDRLEIELLRQALSNHGSLGAGVNEAPHSKRLRGIANDSWFRSGEQSSWRRDDDVDAWAHVREPLVLHP